MREEVQHWVLGTVLSLHEARALVQLVQATSRLDGQRCVPPADVCVQLLCCSTYTPILEDKDELGAGIGQQFI